MLEVEWRESLQKEVQAEKQTNAEVSQELPPDTVVLSALSLLFLIVIVVIVVMTRHCPSFPCSKISSKAYRRSTSSSKPSSNLCRYLNTRFQRASSVSNDFPPCFKRVSNDFPTCFKRVSNDFLTCL
jgi:hypothetical protein